MSHAAAHDALFGDLAASRHLVVLTGAGMSLASGIPTFRGTDPDAVWAHDVMEMGTFGFFDANPVESWRWYRSRFAKLRGAQPNDGHRALVDLERWQRARGRNFLLVTQNIDALHRAAGSGNLVEVHGKCDFVRCSVRGCELGEPRGSIPAAEVDFTTFDADPSPTTLPRCPRCGAPVRAHVLWFDEFYDAHVDYQFRRAIRALEQADLVLFIGTSFSVGVTTAALDTPATKWTIDPSDADAPWGVRLLKEAQEVALPALVARLAGPA
jgi:NAD-dependent deacetylase